VASRRAAALPIPEAAPVIATDLFMRVSFPWPETPHDTPIARCDQQAGNGTSWQRR
jgi:hypothetical protein